MKHFKYIRMFTAFLLLPAVSPAAEHPAGGEPAGRWYFGALFGSAEYEESVVRSNEPAYFGLLAGRQFNRSVAVEGRVAIGMQAQSSYFMFAPPVGLRMDSLFGVYVRAQAPLGSCCKLYAIAGVTSAQFSADRPIAASSNAQLSGSAGLGFSWDKAAPWALDVEYMPVLARGTGWRSDSVLLGVRYHS